MLSDEQREVLRAPFPPEALSSDTSRGFELTSIKAIYVVERLNDAFGVGGWRYTVHDLEIGDSEVTCWIELEVGEMVRYDQAGVPMSKWVPSVPPIRAAGGRSIRKGHLADALKGSVTDGLTKAASMLEVGLEVFQGRARAGRPGAQPSNPRFEIDGREVAELRELYKGKLSAAEVRSIISEVTGGGSTWSSVRSAQQWRRIREAVQERVARAA